MTPYVLQREQWIPRPIDDVFAFFADAANLEAITPPWLGFHMLTPAPIAMHAGTQIRYQLRVHGLPMRWLTEIQTWNPPRQFCDVQLRGPYRLWEHTHSFEPHQGGTRMCDVVRYALPLGPLGRLVHACFVRSDLQKVFDYRAAKIDEILGARHAHQ